MPVLAQTTSQLSAAIWIPTLPFLAMLICGALNWARSPRARDAAAWVTTIAIGLSFVASLIVAAGFGDAYHAGGPEGYQHVIVHYFQWINIGNFSADFSFYIDPLTIVMLMVVTGIGTLISIYAAGYMKGDEGYARFFAYIALFIFAMTCLVLADNLLLLYLGWEGVGVASYLLIGFYYRKPSAVAAAKKAFIVNRIGDFGFALGLMATFVVFGSIQFSEIIPEAARLGTAVHVEGASLELAVTQAPYLAYGSVGLILAIPFLLMLGAFGKSAQLPLHVWLPDAMEGPTPVSALIHAATMVTAGVYMIARLITLFQLNEAALYTIAIVGGITAIFAATIALCQNDLKRVWAYSTLSQLGYMFLGVGVLGTMGAVFHLFTHAFFKALLFLTAGSVMHAMAGQLDLRRMSGLYRKMPVTGTLMLIGCLALAGVPLTAGFYSKDTILTDALAHHDLWWLGVIGIITALLTAFYTFRLWFRVFTGPLMFEMGNEHHGYPAPAPGHGSEHGHVHPDAEERAAADPHHAPAHGEAAHHHEPHEMPAAVNAPLFVLAVGSLIAGYFGWWMSDMIGSSTAAVHAEHDAHHAQLHTIVSIITGVGAVVMIALAWFFHHKRRDLAAKVGDNLAPVVRVLNNAYYIDAAYDYAIRLPLRGVAWACRLFDDVIIDGLIVNTLFGGSPRVLGWFSRTPQQRGALQGYGLAMGLGLVIVLFVVAWKAMAN